MGIRIHKAIGYGLNDLENGYEDPRFNTDQVDRLYESDFNGLKKFFEDENKCIKILTEQFNTKEDIAKFEYSNIKIFLKSIHKMQRTPMPSDFLDFDGEANDNWILFYPAGNIPGGLYSDWKRFDDTIDYYENRIYKKELESIIVDLSKFGALGIYPYNHGMHLKPGKENKLGKHKNLLNENKEDYIEGGLYNMLVGDWDFKQEPLADKNTIKHLKEDWHPIIPVSIKLFVYYFEIFTNPHTVYDLKPLLCQWWA